MGLCVMFARCALASEVPTPIMSVTHTQPGGWRQLMSPKNPGGTTIRTPNGSVRLLSNRRIARMFTMRSRSCSDSVLYSDP